MDKELGLKSDLAIKLFKSQEELSTREIKYYFSEDVESGIKLKLSEDKFISILKEVDDKLLRLEELEKCNSK